MDEDGRFETFEDWVENATRLLNGQNAVCVDARFRRCRIGADFMRARDEGAFPVRFYFPEIRGVPVEVGRYHGMTLREIADEQREEWR